MTLDSLKGRLPAYAKDLKLNLGAIPTAAGLTEQQLWGTVLAAAIASRNGELIAAAEASAAEHLDETAAEAARAAAAVMGMNNIYYRFTHLVGHEAYRRMPARLRMNVVARPGVESRDFELWSLAVSAVNGCGMCIEAHEAQLIEAGMTREAIQDSVRIAAILHGVATALDAEAARAAPRADSAA